MRYQEEQIVRVRGDGESFFLGILAIFAYSPFLMIAILVGEFFHKKFALTFFPSAIIGIIAGCMAYALIMMIEGFSDDLKQKENPLYLLIKILVFVFVAGLPFQLGYWFGSGLIKDPSALFSKYLTGIFLGLLFAIPVYRQVILSTKED
jgi:hypothetical protein